MFDPRSELQECRLNRHLNRRVLASSSVDRFLSFVALGMISITATLVHTRFAHAGKLAMNRFDLEPDDPSSKHRI